MPALFKVPIDQYHIQKIPSIPWAKMKNFVFFEAKYSINKSRGKAKLVQSHLQIYPSIQDFWVLYNCEDKCPMFKGFYPVKKEIACCHW